MRMVHFGSTFVVESSGFSVTVIEADRARKSMGNLGKFLEEALILQVRKVYAEVLGYLNTIKL